MNTLFTIGIVAMTVYLIYDIYVVYITTHQINMMIENNINLLKSQSLVSMYINTPKLKDPIEAVLDVLEKFVLCWFILISYTFISFIYILRGPIIIF